MPERTLSVPNGSTFLTGDRLGDIRTPGFTEAHADLASGIGEVVLTQNHAK